MIWQDCILFQACLSFRGSKIVEVAIWQIFHLKETATLMISMFYQKELYEP